MLSAEFSPCRRYRYTLAREYVVGRGWVSGSLYWAKSGKLAVFCGLNPSTADETTDDPTVRRELAFARAWGCSRYVKVNAYAYRSTDPKGLWKVDDPIGPGNFRAVIKWAREANIFVAAWGNNIRPIESEYLRSAFVALGVQVHALKLTRLGQPQHTLYLPKTLKPRTWEEGTLR